MATVSKIKVVKHPALPATCAVCYRSADGVVDFLDWQLSLDYYGAVLVCEDCAREMLVVLGFAPVAEVTSRNEQIENLTIRNRELVEENERVRAALNSILAVRPDLRSDSDGNDDLDSENSQAGIERGTSKK